MTKNYRHKIEHQLKNKNIYEKMIILKNAINKKSIM